VGLIAGLDGVSTPPSGLELRPLGRPARTQWLSSIWTKFPPKRRTVARAGPAYRNLFTQSAIPLGGRGEDWPCSESEPSRASGLGDTNPFKDPARDGNVRSVSETSVSCVQTHTASVTSNQSPALVAF
jgi:hypothetical protein